jgi:hypothetical protein
MVEARQASGGGVRAKELRLLLGVASSALVAVGVAAIAAAGFAAASVYRHDHFGSNAYGLGIYEQMIWGYSRLEPTMDLTVGAAGAPNLLGSHFQLILAALAPSIGSGTTCACSSSPRLFSSRFRPSRSSFGLAESSASPAGSFARGAGLPC